MGKEFIDDTSYSGYVFLGCAKGQFQPEGGGEERPYYNSPKTWSSSIISAV